MIDEWNSYSPPSEELLKNMEYRLYHLNYQKVEYSNVVLVKETSRKGMEILE